MYLFLSLFYPSLSLCQYKFMRISFNPVFFISVYSFYIHLYLFLPLVYPHLFLYIPLLINFQLHFLYLSLILIYPPASIFISFLSITISFYLFVNPNSLLSLSILFSLSLSILRISTYICFYLLSIHFYFFISLCQCRLMPITFNPIFFISA